MADPLYELLAPYFDRPSVPIHSRPAPSDPTTSTYLSRLTTLPLEALTTSEPAALSQANHSVLRSLQALSKRSHRSVIAATDHLSNLSDLLPSLATQASGLDHGLPALETAASEFAKKYDRNVENAVLDRRKQAMLLSRNVDRVGDVLELPSLLSTSIGSSSSTGGQSSTGAVASGYASALDLHAHVKRLRSLYPDSGLVENITKQADGEIQNLITILVTGLQSQSLKLAGAMRTVGWLRRVAPDLGEVQHTAAAGGLGGFVGQGTGEGSLGALFLVCRLTTLRRTLEALEPLKELADQETTHREGAVRSMGKERWTGGAQSERYLKRFIEIFREQSFASISMYKSIFPSALPAHGSTSMNLGPSLPSTPSPSVLKSTSLVGRLDAGSSHSPATSAGIPSALATFAPHLVDTLLDTLQIYLPNVSERTSRDSLLTQVLYCAGSLGRLGADFGMMLAVMEDELRQGTRTALAVPDNGMMADESEWVVAMKSHRLQASRLDLLASGVGSGGKLPVATSPA